MMYKCLLDIILTEWILNEGYYYKWLVLLDMGGEFMNKDSQTLKRSSLPLIYYE